MYKILINPKTDIFLTHFSGKIKTLNNRPGYTRPHNCLFISPVKLKRSDVFPTPESPKANSFIR